MWYMYSCGGGDDAYCSENIYELLIYQDVPVWSIVACKQKEVEVPKPRERSPKKPRLVFTDIQRRTLHAIFKETKRPSKEMQATIAKQLGLELTTVANFFMNARRRYHKFQPGDVTDLNDVQDNSVAITQSWGWYHNNFHYDVIVVLSNNPHYRSTLSKHIRDNHRLSSWTLNIPRNVQWYFYFRKVHTL